MMQIEITAFQELALGFARSEVGRIGVVKVWPLLICRGTKFQTVQSRFKAHRYGLVRRYRLR